MALFRRSSSDAHWSKDYIEHLRSVHFVLMVVAVTCIAVGISPNVVELENAQHQIGLIVGALAKNKTSRTTVRVGDELDPSTKPDWFVISGLVVSLNPYSIVSVCNGINTQYRIDYLS